MIFDQLQQYQYDNFISFLAHVLYELNDNVTYERYGGLWQYYMAGHRLDPSLITAIRNDPQSVINYATSYLDANPFDLRLNPNQAVIASPSNTTNTTNNTTTTNTSSTPPQSGSGATDTNTSPVDDYVSVYQTQQLLRTWVNSQNPDAYDCRTNSELSYSIPTTYECLISRGQGFKNVCSTNIPNLAPLFMYWDNPSGSNPNLIFEQYDNTQLFVLCNTIPSYYDFGNSNTYWNHNSYHNYLYDDSSLASYDSRVSQQGIIKMKFYVPPVAKFVTIYLADESSNYSLGFAARAFQPPDISSLQSSQFDLMPSSSTIIDSKRLEQQTVMYKSNRQLFVVFGESNGGNALSRGGWIYIYFKPITVSSISAFAYQVVCYKNDYIQWFNNFNNYDQYHDPI